MMLAPIKFTKERQEAYLDLLRKGIRRGAAARKIGLHRTTVTNYSNNHPKFAAAVVQAEMDANDLVEQAMFKSAIEGNVTAQQVWLYNRDPERWSDRRNSPLDVRKFEFEANDVRKLMTEIEELKEQLAKK